jgi:dihydroxy-acid dehydratase
MSGTSYGACILHVSPEAAIGGTLALVESGDMIEVDVEARTIHLDVPEAELQKRREAWQPKPVVGRGYERMFAAHIQQAHDGCDFDFLTGTERLPEPEIH